MTKTFQVIIALTGIFLITKFDGGYDAFGVFLMLWANNIDR